MNCEPVSSADTSTVSVPVTDNSGTETIVGKSLPDPADVPVTQTVKSPETVRCSSRPTVKPKYLSDYVSKL